jgi:hypothetical protein
MAESPQVARTVGDPSPPRSSQLSGVYDQYAFGCMRQLSTLPKFRASLGEGLQQVEYCRNLIFRRNFPIHKLFDPATSDCCGSALTAPPKSSAGACTSVWAVS